MLLPLLHQNWNKLLTEPTTGGCLVSGDAVETCAKPSPESGNAGVSIGGLATVSLIERSDAWKCEEQLYYVELENIESFSNIKRYDFTGKRPGALLSPITICNQGLAPIFKTIERLKREKFND